MSEAPSSEVFTFGSTAVGTTALVPAAPTITIPKGAKAVLTSVVQVLPAVTALLQSVTITASGGQTGIIAYASSGAAAAGNLTVIADGEPISEVIDATTAAVTLTITQVQPGAGASAGAVYVTGKYIS